MALQCCDECMADLVVGNDQFLFVCLLYTSNRRIGRYREGRMCIHVCGERFSLAEIDTIHLVSARIGKLYFHHVSILSKNAVI